MLDFLYNPQGRISRKGYAVAFLVPYLVLTFLVAPLFGLPGLILCGLFFLWPKNGAVPVRRMHDMGITGKYQFGFVVLGILANIMFLKGLSTVQSGIDGFESMAPKDQYDALAEYLRSGTASELMLGSLMILGVELAQVLFFGLVKGQAGPNRFGNDPLAEGRGYAD